MGMLWLVIVLAFVLLFLLNAIRALLFHIETVVHYALMSRELWNGLVCSAADAPAGVKNGPSYSKDAHAGRILLTVATKFLPTATDVSFPRCTRRSICCTPCCKKLP